MKHNVVWVISLMIVTIVPGGWIMARNDEARNPIPLAIALKLGPEKLTKVIDWGESEAGQDEAANIYATALRIKTDYSLALRDVQLVTDLNEWRMLLSKCRCGVWEIAAAHNGGGTMWGHNAAREVAPVEDFVANMATRSPFERGKGSKDAARRIDKAISHVKSLKVENELNPHFQKTVQDVSERWIELKEKISTLSKDEADRIAGFVVEDAMTVEKAGEG